VLLLQGLPDFQKGGEFALGVDQQQAAATSKQRDRYGTMALQHGKMWCLQLNSC
jgi:hypothetical protein